MQGLLRRRTLSSPHNPSIEEQEGIATITGRFHDEPVMRSCALFVVCDAIMGFVCLFQLPTSVRPNLTSASKLTKEKGVYQPFLLWIAVSP